MPPPDSGPRPRRRGGGGRRILRKYLALYRQHYYNKHDRDGDQEGDGGRQETDEEAQYATLVHELALTRLCAPCYMRAALCHAQQVAARGRDEAFVAERQLRQSRRERDVKRRRRQQQQHPQQHPQQQTSTASTTTAAEGEEKEEKEKKNDNPATDEEWAAKRLMARIDGPLVQAVEDVLAFGSWRRGIDRGLELREHSAEWRLWMLELRRMRAAYSADGSLAEARSWRLAVGWLLELSAHALMVLFFGSRPRWRGTW